MALSIENKNINLSDISFIYSFIFFLIYLFIFSFLSRLNLVQEET